MRLLLDTHVFLWAIGEPSRLSQEATKTITAPGNQVWVSLASAWEIAIKTKLKKLAIPGPLTAFFQRACDDSGFDILPIKLMHLQRTMDLPLEHRDPFDRLLSSQALDEQMSIVSRDAALDKFSVQRIW